MPIRQRFGNWTEFIKEMGLKPLEPKFSELARKNSALAHKGKRSFGWKGGRIIDANGYVMVYEPNHPNTTKKGYIGEHRLVMSKYLERPLTKGENVHHKDGNRQNNELSNLELWNTTQPSGQRIEDKIKWAKEILKIYENFENPELLKQRANTDDSTETPPTT
jgi:hypothetical protein